MPSITLITQNSIVAIILLLFAPSLLSQNLLYNSEQFGIDGAMLGGAVTAGSEDVSMTFYNPAAIHKVPAQFSISIVQPRLSNFGFREFWGPNESSKRTTQIGLKPALISVKFKVKDLNIAFLNISKSDFSDIFRAEQEQENSSRRITQYFDYRFEGKDDWFGIGTNKQLAPNLYVGLSQFVRSGSFSYRNHAFVEEIDTHQDEAVNQFTGIHFNGAYSNIGLISKMGLLLDTETHDIGFTITTPTYLRISRSGDLYFSRARFDDRALTVDQVIDTDISPVIRSPWEFTLGYSLQLTSRHKIWSNVSYHTRIAEYDMATASTFNSQTSWRNGSRSIVNVSLGYSQVINPMIELSGAIRTNNFAYENKPASQEHVRSIILDGNHVHMVLGSKIGFKRSTILVGIDYGTIRDVPDADDFQQLAALNAISPNLNSLRKNSFSLLITYGFIVDEIKNWNKN